MRGKHSTKDPHNHTHIHKVAVTLGDTKGSQRNDAELKKITKDCMSGRQTRGSGASLWWSERARASERERERRWGITGSLKRHSTRTFNSIHDSIQNH